LVPTFLSYINPAAAINRPPPLGGTLFSDRALDGGLGVGRIKPPVSQSSPNYDHRPENTSESWMRLCHTFRNSIQVG